MEARGVLGSAPLAASSELIFFLCLALSFGLVSSAFVGGYWLQAGDLMLVLAFTGPSVPCERSSICWDPLVLVSCALAGSCSLLGDNGGLVGLTP